MSEPAELSREKLDLLIRRLRAAKKPAQPPGPSAASTEIEVPAGPPLGSLVSAGQERLWFLERLRPGAAYNLPAALHLVGPLDVPALAAALAEIARRHAPLRTVFAEREGRPQAVLQEGWRLCLPVVDLAALPAAMRESATSVLAAEEGARPFDLAGAPPVRTRLLRPGEREHALLLTLHHVAADGASMGVLAAELSALYGAYAAGAYAAGRPSPLPPLPLRFADWVRRERQRTEAAALAPLVAWWRERLAGLPERLELPADRPRAQAPSGRGIHRAVHLPPELHAAIGDLARRSRATPFVVLLAAWKSLLLRWSGEDDLAIGSPLARREEPGAEHLIGFLVDTVVMRTGLGGDPSFHEATARVRETALAAWDHSGLPFERLVEAVAPGRSLLQGPVVQVLFAFQEAPTPALVLPGLAVGRLEVERESAKLDLLLDLEATADGALAGHLEASRDLFFAATVERAARWFETLVAGAVAAPERRLSELPLLSGAEHHQLLHQWSARSVGEPPEERGAACVHELFAEQAAARPEAIALEWRGGRLTYSELAAEAGRLGRRLRAAGAGPEVRVAIYLERSAGFVVAALATLQSGAAYVPLDSSFPAERLAFLLADSGSTLLVSERRLKSGLPDPLPPGIARVVWMDEEGETATGDSLRAAKGGVTGASGPRPSPESLAYVLYTSGSTGRPKGVAVPHRGIARLVRGAGFADLSSHETFLMLAPVAFDASTLEIWGPLANGGRLVIFPAGEPLDRLGVALREHEVTALWLTAGLFHQVVDTDLSALAPLRQLLAGGDTLSAVHVRRALAALPGCRLVDGYGPTENTTFTCCQILEGADEVPDTVPIGRPIGGTRVVLLDRWGALAPLGAPGELCTGGAGLARGYLDRPELTAERFVPAPGARNQSGGALGARSQSGGALGARNQSGDALGARLYRTGDLARWRPDGRLELLGRLDRQVKVRGFRVELGEVEGALAAHPAVAGCAVVALPDPAGGGRRLLAGVVPRPGTELPAAAELRRFLGATLPEPMIPARLLALSALPLTPNGKVDREALGRQLATLDAEASPAAPAAAFRSPLGEMLAGLFADLLGRDRVGPEEDFFELGGHSLLATRLASRIREATGVELPLAELFATPTAAGLAEYLEPAVGRGGEAKALDVPALVPPILPASRTEDLPLSFAQERLWFLDRLDPGNPVYNVPLAVEARGSLAVPVLAAALAEVVRRHEALRTTLPERGGRAVQIVSPPAAVPLPVLDLSALPPGVRAEAARDLLAEEGARCFDLAAGPLLRAAVLRLAAAEQVLFVNVHHVAADGWSMGVLLAELAALCGALAAGRPSPLPPLSVQYGDFAVWQREWMAGTVLDRQLAYWRDRLAGLPVLELPTDRPRPPARRLRGSSRPVRFPPALAAAAERLARASGATPFMVFLTAFQALLTRWSGQEDFAVGSPVANRRRPELEGLIGLFVNTLVLRATLADAPDGRQALARVRRACLDAYAHQDLPFDRLVEELAPERELGRTPLAQVMLAYQTSPVGPLALPGLALAPLPVPSRTARFDLTLSLFPGAGGLAGALEHDRDLFDGATAERLLRQLSLLLDGLCAEPGRRLAELPLLSPEEDQQVRVEWNAPATAGAPHLPVHALFAEQAARTPDAVALAGDEESWSYGELARTASRLARHLSEAGVGPEVRVAVCLDRSATYVIAILAALEAGGAYLPLDPAYPADRLAYLLADSGATVLLTEERFLARLPEALPETVRRVIRLDSERALLRRDPAEGTRARRLEVGPDSLAYVMYTSGSTGKPKGVAVPHRGIVRLVRETGWATLDRGEVFLLLTPLSFDVSTFEIWGALANGGRLAVLPGSGVVLAELGEAIQRHGVTTLWLSAGLFHQMVELDLPALAPLRQLVAGGDALSAPHVRRALAGLPHGRVIDGYGPTENTTFTACCSLRTPEEVAAAVSIGRPIAGTTIHLVSREGELAPVGVPGELWTGGEGLARGYLGRPELTAERFVPDGFGGALGARDRSGGAPGARNGSGAAPGARLYRTGDLARWRPDGRIEFLGRLDHQVKVRGFRIELGEVEAALAGHPAVRECAVVALPDPAGGGKRLAAYLAADESAPPVPELRRHLAARLPEFMIPSFFVFLPTLPLSPNGKVDRRALPAPDARGSSGATYVAPRTPVEEMLAGLWQDLLGIERAGVEDGFFELGGHSLLATRLVARVRQSFGVEVPLRRLFERPTLGAFAAEIAAASRGEEEPLPPIAPALRSEAPLSWAQERLWILERIEPGTAAYNVPVACDWRGDLRADLLARALAEVVRRHGALRTRFGARGGHPFQSVDDVATVPLPRVDLSGLPTARAEPEAARLAVEEAALPFDLTRAPLLRARLLRLETTRWRLLLDAHHIAADGWSMGLLVGELAALYAALARGAGSPLSPLPVQYVDYAVWERCWRTPEALAGQLGYWKNQLADPPALELPADRPRRAVRTFRGDRRSLILSPGLSNRLRGLGGKRGATLFMTLLAAFAVVLGRLGGEEDLTVGTPVAGRLRAEVEGLVGMFLNTLVLRLDLAGAPSFEALLGRVRETALAAYAHQEVPFEMLLDVLQPERDLARTPLFQVFFNLLNFPWPEIDLPGLTLTEAAAPEPPAKLDLTLYVRERSNRIGIDAVWNADLFDGSRIAEVLGQLESVLEQVAADPAVPVAGLSLLTPRALAVLPDPRAELDATWRGAVHELFSRRARQHPRTLAVTDRDGKWTYEEVEGRANRLAWRLVAAGLRPGETVAVLAHRSAALSWTVLGVLKAGGAFLLLDPAYPGERLAEMVRLARPAAWIQLAAAGAPATEVAAWAAAALPAARRLVMPAEGLPGGDRPQPPPVVVGPDDVAYLAFTSGSTGVPKGILGRHGPLSHFLPWMAERYGFGPADRFSLLSALAHDPLQRDLFTPLCLGARLAIPDPAEMMLPGRLAAWMRREAVTVANLTPAMAQVVTEAVPEAAPEAAPAAADTAPLPALRYVFLVGDALTRWIVARLRRLAPQVTCINHYGSTETQRAVGYHVIPPGAGEGEESREVLPLGRGIPGVQLLVLARGRSSNRVGLAGIGEVGEIALRSPHLAAGYLEDAELTRERFPENPFTGRAGDRIYRTGDLGRYLPDGEVAFAGRADHQVKVRGFRIELGEIEGRLARLPGVREAMVLAREEGPGERRLVAYVVPEPGAAPSAAELRRRLTAQVPAYMVPAAFLVLERLPLTGNGKVDRRALLRLAVGREARLSYRAPESDVEKRIAAILQEVLRVERVGVDDNFFDLGASSLALVEAHARLEASFGRDVAVVDLFSNPTVAALAERLAESAGAGEALAVPIAALSEERSDKLREGRRMLRRRLEQRQR